MAERKPLIRVPFRYVSELPRRAQIELFRNFEELAGKIAPVPFIVVASDGTGDYTSIKKAIEANPSDGTDDQTLVVLVRSLGTTYNDNGAGAVAVDSHTELIIIGEGDVYPAVSTGTTKVPAWQFDGFAMSATAVTIIGISINPTAHSIISSGSGIAVKLIRCFLSLVSVASSGIASCRIQDCVLTTSSAASLAGNQYVLERCFVNGMGGTNTWTATTVKFIDCTGANTSGTLTFSGIAELVFENHHFTHSSSNPNTFTVASPSAALAVVVRGCHGNATANGSSGFLQVITFNVPMPTPSVGIGKTNMGSCVFEGNALPGTTVSITGTSVTGGVRISGVYSHVTLGSGISGAIMDISVEGYASSSTAVTMSCDNSLARIAVGPAGATGSTGTTGLLLDGSSSGNIVQIVGSGAATQFTDSGSSNNVNALAPNGSAGGDLTGSFPNPTLDLTKAHTWTAEQQALDLVATGLTGATAASRYVGATASGAPASGTFAVGDFVVDQTGTFWVCTTAGSPGSWSKPTSAPTAPSFVVYGTAGGTFTKASYSGLRAVRIRCVGSGGAGGGGAGGANLGVGGGGGGGGYAEALVAAASLATSETVTVGTGGAGVSGSQGNDGAATSFGAWCVAAGGSGGHSTPSTTNAGTVGGAGGTSSAGDIKATGDPGQIGRVISSSISWPGTGGGSKLGGGGLTASAGSADGGAGGAYGGGGGGASANSATSRTGGAGADGICIVELIF